MNCMSVVNRKPKQIMTVRIQGMRAAGWSGQGQPSAAISAITIIRNLKYYVPLYLQINHVTITTPRSLTGGQVGSATGGYSQLASIGIQLLGNWLGYPVTSISGGYTGAFYDIVKEFILDMSQVNRNRVTYYPSKCEGLVFGTNVVENYGEGAQNNPYVVQLTMPADTPVIQTHDLTMDVNPATWIFQRALTEEEKMLDPWYQQRKKCQEQHQEFLFGMQELKLSHTEKPADRFTQETMLNEDIQKTGEGVV